MTMKCLAIDPGNVLSAYIVWDGKTVYDRGKIPNRDILNILSRWKEDADVLVIERMGFQGGMAGQTVFDTCRWIGMFEREWEILTKGKDISLVFRSTVKSHFKVTRTNHKSIPGKLYCARNDTEVRKSLINRFGKPGSKAKPNLVTYGIVNDIWSAFAIAVYWVDINQAQC